MIFAFAPIALHRRLRRRPYHYGLVYAVLVVGSNFFGRIRLVLVLVTSESLQ